MKENKDIQPIDKLFRQSLDGYSPAPPASVWKKIKSKLGRGGASPLQFFTTYGGLFILSAVILSITGILIYNSYFSANLQSENKQITNVTDKKAKTGVNRSQLSSQPAHVTSTPDPDQVKLSNKPSTLILKADSLIRNKLKTNAYSGKEDLNASLEGKSGKQNTAKQMVKFPNGNNPVNYSTRKSEVSESGILKPKTTTVNSETVVSRSNQNKENLSSTDATGVSSSIKQNAVSDTFSLSQPVVENPVVSNITIPENNNEISDRPSKPDENKTISIPEGISPSSLPSSDPLPENNPQASTAGSFRYYIGAGGSIGQVMLKGLNPNNFYSVNAVVGGKHRNSKISIETGIGFSYYKDRGKYEFEFQRKDTSGYTSITLFNKHDSSYLFIFNPVTNDSTLLVDTNTSSSYTYLKIPLYLSKQLFRFGKFAIGIKTGPSCDLLITSKEAKPEYQLPGTKYISLTNNSYSMLSASWQWMVAPQFSWDITEKIIFRFEPAMVFYLNNLYEKNNRPASKPNGIGIWTGLQYNF